MNMKQRIMLLSGLVLIVIMGICPPRDVFAFGSNFGIPILIYKWIPLYIEYHSVNFIRLGIQWIIVLILVGLGMWMTKKKHNM